MDKCFPLSGTVGEMGPLPKREKDQMVLIFKRLFWVASSECLVPFISFKIKKKNHNAKNIPKNVFISVNLSCKLKSYKGLIKSNIEIFHGRGKILVLDVLEILYPECVWAGWI